MHKRNEAIVFTSSVRSQEAVQLVEQAGMAHASFPLIQTVEVIGEDERWLQRAKQVDWIIFTSQNAVRFFVRKCERFALTSSHFPRIASVGSKTTALLEKHGFVVSFMPSIYSADVFVKEFPEHVKNDEHILFVKGNLAKSTIADGLSNLEQWVVYETVPNFDSVEPFIEYMTHQKSIVVFASPSAVNVYNEYVAPKFGWHRIHAAAIGHVTAAALQSIGVEVFVQPKEYTLLAVVQEILTKIVND